MPDSPSPPPLDYASPDSNPRRRTHPITWAIAAIIVSFLYFSMLLDLNEHRGRPVANRIKCSSNLRQLGQAMLLYANDYQGHYPDTMGELLEEDVPIGVYICPDTNDTPAAVGPTTQATAANLHAGGHLSYIYLGKGLTGTPPPKMVLAYEPLANHGNKGMNVLFGDGHVEFITPPTATALLAELASGHNPPRTMIP